MAGATSVHKKHVACYLKTQAQMQAGMHFHVHGKYVQLGLPFIRSA